jgi:hypothetical protein
MNDPIHFGGNMAQSKRVLAAVLILVVIVGAVLGVDALRRGNSLMPVAEDQATPTPGSVPIYEDGQLVGRFGPGDLDRLKRVSFVEAEEGKEQEGWLLRDVLLLYVEEESLKADTLITVSSSSRDKSVQLNWAEVNQPANMVMFDLSNRGTLKLASLLEKLDTRDEWVQDVDKIEIAAP